MPTVTGCVVIDLELKCAWEACMMILPLACMFVLHDDSTTFVLTACMMNLSLACLF